MGRAWYRHPRQVAVLPPPPPAVPDTSFLPALSPATLAWLALAAAGVGMSKSGLAGLGMVHIVIFAAVFGARASTGVLLPLLVLGDILAVLFVAKVPAMHLGRVFGINRW